ncbi:MAG: antibiotic biosynthesis monooxygenase [Candidatus Saccharicenans sp.]|nr:antibiotic biosynthesis monooxygenase [Candidatus Saccharicenans sp.]
MIARVTIIRVRPEKVDEAIKLYETSVIPETKMQPGFAGGYLLTDRASGRGISLTFWQSQEDATASEENLHYQQQLLKFLDMFASPPIKEEYTVNIKF